MEFNNLYQGAQRSIALTFYRSILSILHVDQHNLAYFEALHNL